MTTNKTLQPDGSIRTTLEDAIRNAKCRKGPADGITKNGAYWLVASDQLNKQGRGVVIRSYGGDGIGNSAPNMRNYLALRHYRNGDVRACVTSAGWHQNHAVHTETVPVDILSCCTAEEVIAVLRGVEDSNDVHVLSAHYEDDLVKTLTALGLPECDPSPDDE